MTEVLGAAAWVARWDRQQEVYVPDREEIFDLMFDVVERLAGTPRRVLDLASGPGSLAARAAQRFPDAEVVALDIDPVLVTLGRVTYGERLRWVEADLRTDDWATELPAGEFDAIVTATALHWLDADRWPSLAEGLARLLRPGGVHLDYDQILTDRDTPRLAALTDALHRESWRPESGAEDWQAWWQAIEADPAMATLVAERARRFDGRRVGTGSTLGQRTGALVDAGFREVNVIHQVADRRLLAAIR